MTAPIVSIIQVLFMTATFESFLCDKSKHLFTNNTSALASEELTPSDVLSEALPRKTDELVVDAPARSHALFSHRH